MNQDIAKRIGSGLLVALLGTTSAFAAAGHFGTTAGLKLPAITLAAATKSPDSDIVTLAPPIASPYLWSATKSADGSIALAGFVPSQDVRGTLLDDIAKVTNDTTSVAAGQPEGFATDAVAALNVLDTLDVGKVSFDGASWTVSGSVDSTDKATAASAAFAASPLKDIGAAYAVTGPTAAEPSTPATAEASKPAAAAPASPAPDETAAPAPAVPASPAAAAPAASDSAAPAPTPASTAMDYAWSAEKAADDTISFSGSVPTPVLKKFLAGHVDGKVVDNSAVASGAPKGFIGGALYGLDALMALNSGKLAFADGHWSLAGVAKDAAADKAATGALGVIDTKTWNIDITTAPAIASAPAVIPTPAAPSQAASAPATAPASAATGAAAPDAGAATAGDTAAAAAPSATESASPAATPAADYTFTASKSAGGAIVLSGDVPTDGAKGYFGDIVGGVPTDGLKIVPHAPDNFIIEALGGLDALGKLDSGELTLAGGKWSLKGSAATPELHDSVVASIGALPGGNAWTTDVAGPAPIAVCRAKLADLAKSGGGILFDTKTHFAKGTEATLDAVAAALAACPDSRVNIEGNTDSDGDADANMALSVARAETVVDALAKRGVKADRLYAVGYGETVPLVPNTTKANKAKNRRIDIKIVDAPQK